MSWPPGVGAGQRVQHRAGVTASLRLDLRGRVPRCTRSLHSGPAHGRHPVPHLLERLFPPSLGQPVPVWVSRRWCVCRARPPESVGPCSARVCQSRSVELTRPGRRWRASGWTCTPVTALVFLGPPTEAVLRIGKSDRSRSHSAGRWPGQVFGPGWGVARHVPGADEHDESIDNEPPSG